MGISTPKKPFDLKAFLSEKGKPRSVRRGYPIRGKASEAEESPEVTESDAEADAEADAPEQAVAPDTAEK
ncbi:MAG: hypothetical protein ACK4GT_19570 [Pararhodobacter sp.]